MSECNKWGEQNGENLSSQIISGWSIFFFTTLSPYLARPFLIAVCMLGKDWFIAWGSPSPITPSGIHLVHAKLKLIHIWADQHPPTSILSCDLVCLHWSVSQFAKRKNCEGLHNCAHPCFWALTHGRRRSSSWEKDEKKSVSLWNDKADYMTPQLWYRPDWIWERTDKQEHLSSQALSSLLPPNPFKHYLYLWYLSEHLLLLSFFPRDGVRFLAMRKLSQSH